MENRRDPEALQPAVGTAADVPRVAANRPDLPGTGAVGPGGVGPESALSSGAALIAEIRALEDEKSALSARQARLSVEFDLLQRREQAAAGVPAAELGAGVAAQIALARRESPAKGGRRRTDGTPGPSPSAQPTPPPNGP